MQYRLMIFMEEDITRRIEKEGISFIELNFTDIFGTLKSIAIPIGCYQEAVDEGVWFDGSSIKGFARIKESDMYLKPDLTTYAVIPCQDGKKKTARFFCDIFTPEGILFEGSPRAVLKRAIKEAEDMGFRFKVGPEVEFYLFKKKEDGSFIVPDSDNSSYFDSAIGDIGSEVRKEIMVRLKAVGIDSERAHHEVGAGQHEIGFRYGDALATADRVVTLKNIIRSVAHEYGLVASFMPKPLFRKAGSGMHIHFSLFDAEGNPLFYDEKDKDKLSPLAKHFIAGQLAYAREMSALLNPTVNSYKRLVAGYEAPVYICWGSKNRSSLVRIPRYTRGKNASARAEIRCPDPSASPYLAFAAILKAGLEGIRNKIVLMPETEDSVFEKPQEELEKLEIKILPRSLSESISEFKKSRHTEDKGFL